MEDSAGRTLLRQAVRQLRLDDSPDALFLAWAQQAFADFSAKQSVEKETFVNAMAPAMMAMAKNRDDGWIDHIVAACSADNFKGIYHQSIVLKSYHDVSVPTAALAIFVAALADSELWPGTTETALTLR